MDEDSAWEYLKKLSDAIEGKIIDELERDSSISGCSPDKRAVEAKIEKERQEIMSGDESDAVKKALSAVLNVVAENLRRKPWG